MYRLLLKSCLVFLVVCISEACSSEQHENAATQNLSGEDKVRYEQYLVQGEDLYQARCANCHQVDGSGLRRLIPPLAHADYMLEDINRTLCLIRHGRQGKIIVNNIDYQQKMPANTRLTNIEVTQIANFIYNSWGNEHGFIRLQDASSALDSCQP